MMAETYFERLGTPTHRLPRSTRSVMAGASRHRKRIADDPKLHLPFDKNPAFTTTGAATTRANRG
jgi:hypothetical protein